ncbi:MAG: alpha/beta hydrolase-fold protein [Prosthecobacter sp.]|nr:alpha/beta hydrolase-fold protein [Prosthecobacter sp.]
MNTHTLLRIFLLVIAMTGRAAETTPATAPQTRLASRAGCALEGFSMGGFGVMKLGAKYPQTFCSLLTYGGALVEEQTMPVRHSGTFTLMFGGKVELFRESDLRVWMKKYADEVRRSVRIRQVIGTKDATSTENQPGSGTWLLLLAEDSTALPKLTQP